MPSRVRTDHGDENNSVCLLMSIFRCSHRGSALRGRSTHNQRIERLWGDLWRGVSNVYYDLFNFLESEGIIDIDNEMHMWALHYVAWNGRARPLLPCRASLVEDKEMLRRSQTERVELMQERMLRRSQRERESRADAGEDAQEEPDREGRADAGEDAQEEPERESRADAE
ncbi:hypothetical protein KUCAC02_004253 [Chaenocephalus aceratus]|uniref:Uncharacterized protein n=1 Tax=Chaenocephalus aceratus TaxID=36190 RepID=A0ACB9WZP0_CHAAC|nr:hypothetical protein KUCAC02_004253 [Chaenocephalus aceratus]